MVGLPPGPSVAPPRRRGFRWRWVVLAVLGVVMAATVWMGILFARVVREMNEGELRMQATMLTCRVVEQYVRTHGGQWPRSWDDLATVRIEDQTAFDWPRDREWLPRYVEVDFGFDPQTVVRGADPAHFKAVQPRGRPIVQAHVDAAAADLIDAILETRAASTAPPAQTQPAP